MQIFVKHPGTGQTLVYSCSPETTVGDFLDWVWDKTWWPPHTYYITYKAKMFPIDGSEARMRTFGELNVQPDDTLHVVGRLINRKHRNN